MPKTERKTAKKPAVSKSAKKRTAVKKAVRKKRVTTKKAVRKTSAKKVQNHSKDKFLFFLGILIIITGASIMIEILGLSIKTSSANYLKDFLLFPIAIIFLLLGIGIVANHSFYSKN